MARSFSNLNALSLLLVNAISRRGYASSSQGFATTATRAGAASVSGKVAKKSGEERVTAEKESWVPDPVTGYYRPENSKEIDVAELRATLLGRK
ncbi:indole-3-acetic acid-induced protein ARG2-like [Prosopis cineraria]|uniref:indole-3-acetic acid-induced protein ARG2-like n=1 Tax=Prosopis cineraria TaxID=364024 RepID=UPI0024106874|nr:indole-3-acetic acid-induced protein ARG2-like [Prosopis cineraria]